MKVNFIKQVGVVLIPANEIEVDRLKRLKTGEMYEVDLVSSRNPAFHGKVFAFFNFVYNYWSADKTEWEHFNEQKQFDTFRKNLTVLAGFKEVSYTIDGRMRVEAKSLAYAKMEQEEFEACYSALINASIKHIFNNTKDQNIINQLYEFF
jgi:hypothetical protein